MRNIHEATPQVPLNQFIQEHPPCRNNESILVPWHNAIVALLGQRYTLNQIREFLGANGVKISLNGISNYLSRARAKAKPESNMSIPARRPSGRTVKTQNTRLSDAEICRRNGWKPGTLLSGTDKQGTSVICLTAIGEDTILAKKITQDGKPVNPIVNRECFWDLHLRDWRRLPCNQDT